MTATKPIDELSADDLAAHPVWEYAVDDEEAHDETYVRPVVSLSVPQEPHVVYHVACEVISADGRFYDGFMSICNGALHDEAPVVVAELGQYWPLDSAPLEHERRNFEKFFGASYEDLLPVRWQLRVHVTGNPGLESGVFEG